MPNPILKVKRLTRTARLPCQMTDGAAGYDICVDEDIVLFPHGFKYAKTGLAVQCPKGHYIEIHIRSSWGKNGVRLANCTGILDEDYRGEIKLYLTNDSGETLFISAGTRVAQLNIMKKPSITIKEVDELDETKRGLESGSTGNTVEGE